MRNKVSPATFRSPSAAGSGNAAGAACAAAVGRLGTGMSLRKVVLITNEALSPTVCLLRFRSDDGAPFTHAAGQWLNLRLPEDAADERRAYSIASMPQGDTFELAVTHVQDGRLSPRLHTLRPGDEAFADGPYGFFTRDHPEAPALFVATGSGLAPIHAMLQSAFATGPSAVPLTLLFGCRSQADILWQPELQGWAAEQPNFELHVTLSRPAAGWTGRTGYVQSHLAALIAQRPVAHAYVCGLSHMVQAVRGTLKPLGLGRGTVHTERYD